MGCFGLGIIILIMRAAAPCLFSSIRDHSLVFLGRNGLLLWNLWGSCGGRVFVTFPEYVQIHSGLRIKYSLWGCWVVGGWVAETFAWHIAEQQQEW